MVSFTVRLKFDEGDRQTLTEMLRKLTEGARREPECVSFIAHFVEGEPLTVLIYEQYVDEAALEFHRTTPHFLEYAKGGFYLLRHTRTVEHLAAVS